MKIRVKKVSQQQPINMSLDDVAPGDIGQQTPSASNDPEVSQAASAICWRCASSMKRYQRTMDKSGIQVLISHWACPVCDERMKSTRGFSLLELLIVVGIILIIATIAIPSLLKSRQSANQSAAVSNLRLVNTAEVTYSSGNQGHYGAISDLVTAGLLDSRYNQVLSGYNFSTTLSADTLDYTALATARAVNDGLYDYYTKPDYVIRYSTDPTRAPSGLTGEPVR